MDYLQEVVESIFALNLFLHFRCAVGEELQFCNILDQDLVRKY